jgi:hypothetical protein
MWESLSVTCNRSGQWFSPGTPVSYTNKTDCHDITDILLKMALNTINLNQSLNTMYEYVKYKTVNGISWTLNWREIDLFEFFVVIWELITVIT